MYIGADARYISPCHSRSKPTLNCSVSLGPTSSADAAFPPGNMGPLVMRESGADEGANDVISCAKCYSYGCHS